MNFRNKNAFTLIEIMLVVIIIGILAAMVIPNMAGRGEQARVAAARADIDANLSTALDLYELDNGQYPTSEQGLNALLAKSSSSPVPANWHGPYLKKKESLWIPGAGNINMRRRASIIRKNSICPLTDRMASKARMISSTGRMILTTKMMGSRTGGFIPLTWQRDSAPHFLL